MSSTLSAEAAPAGPLPAGVTQSRASTARDWPFLLSALGATALLCALVLVEGAYASAALIVLGFALGIVFLKAEFGFTAAWRRFLLLGEAGGMTASLLLIAIAAIIIVPVAALVPGYGGAIAPLGPSLIIGAFVFGIGMQLANACGSGTLYAMGGGSGRMVVGLSTFIIGSVIGTAWLPPLLNVGGVDPVIAGNILGPWAGLAATLASLAIAGGLVIWIAKARGASFRPTRTQLYAAVAIGVLSIALFLIARHPWSVTFGFAVWGAKIGQALGMDFSGWAFWQWPGPARALKDSLLTDTSSLTDFGMIFGAVAAAAWSAPFARRAWPSGRSLLGAALGGLLMGIGARLGFGCNIGAFVGGIASGSLHGWIWFAMALGGSAIGIRLRPFFDLPRL
jgi:uncharacterized protein